MLSIFFYTIKDIIKTRFQRGQNLLKVAIVFLSWSASLGAIAQTAPSTSTISALQIGDQVPDELWNRVLKTKYNPNGKNTLQLKELKDKKLIILDFWATYCGGCIGSIQKFVKTAAYTDPDIAFVPVSHEDEEEITKFNKRFNLNFLTVMDDLALRDYFPYRTIPHIVVIKEGKVLAITRPEVLQPENIQALKNGSYDKELKKDDILDFDKTKEIMAQKNSRVRDAIHTRTVVLGYLPGLPALASGTKDNKEQRVFISNKSLLVAMYNLLPLFWRNRIFRDVVKDGETDRFWYDAKHESSYGLWAKKYGVSIESIAPLDVPKEEFHKNAMITMLNARGYDFYMLEKKVPCQLIYQTVKKEKQYDGATITIEELFNSLNHQPNPIPKVPIYLLDPKINKMDRVKIDYEKMRDAKYLRTALQDIGLDIKQIDSVQPIIEVKERRR